MVKPPRHWGQLLAPSKLLPPGRSGNAHLDLGWWRKRRTVTALSTPSVHPALASFLEVLQSTFDFVEVRVTRLADGFTLHHLADFPVALGKLTKVDISALRAVANTTLEGDFRPIKTAPNLRRGWHCSVPTPDTLKRALDALYPGALVDWFSAQHSPVPVQHYREFTARQTGMYRITQQLTDAQVSEVIRAGCAPQSCLRKRLWTVEGLPPDDETDGKSVIPCLEPCPLLIELVRRSRRMNQEESTLIPLGISELTSLKGALDHALSRPPTGGREGDLGDPLNPRRIRLLRDRLAGLLPPVPLRGAKE